MLAGATRFLNFEQAATRMAEIVIEASRDPRIVSKARELVQNICQGDYAGEAAVLASVARDCIRYTGDPSSEDVYAWPWVTLEQGAGDCNNKVLLFASLARAIGFPVRLLFVFKEQPQDLAMDFPAHVLAEVDVYKGEREVGSWWPVELVPLPDKLNHFPSYTVPFGTMPRISAGHLVRVDVDQVAHA